MHETIVEERSLVLSSEEDKIREKILNILRILGDPRAWRRHMVGDILVPVHIEATEPSLKENNIRQFIVWEADIKFNTVKGTTPHWEEFTELLDFIKKKGG